MVARVQTVDINSSAFSLVPNKDCFVYVYASWCGHCQRFNESGIWEKLVKQEKNLTFAKIESEAYPKFGLKHDVHGYPSFFFVHANGKIVDYPRGRSLEEMKRFIHDEQRKARAARRTHQNPRAAAGGGGRSHRRRRHLRRHHQSTRKGVSY
jgi:thiol-disulfide isomerase/thioredoxin